MKNAVLSLAFCFFAFAALAQRPAGFDGLDMDLGNLSRMSDARTRSISPENFNGGKGQGGMADPVSQ